MQIPEAVFPLNYTTIKERVSSIDPLDYARTRNFTNGGVTYLSPYISRGVISVKQVMNSVLSRGYKPYEVERFLQELAWREYFQRVWQARGNAIMEDIKQPQPLVLHHKMIDAVANAATGINALDAGIELLKTTGYMHNHLRMYTASICCNIAGAYWLQPAKWMYYYLLDGDVASNACSWQWVTGAFAGKKYYFNQENVNKYTASTQENTFMDNSYEVVSSMPVPQELAGTYDLELQTTLPVTSSPVIDTLKPTLIYNSYNLDPNWRKNDDVNRVLLLEPSHFRQYPVGKNVMEFIVSLAGNIAGLQVYAGEIGDICNCYENADAYIISKEHPAFGHYPGIKDSREWMFPNVTGYFSSFFQYWKRCSTVLKYM